MATRKPPWKKGNPKKKSRKLSPAQKATAKKAAKKAGRRYPNLVDNMRAAAKAKKTGTRKSAKRKASKH